jgi:glycosyltransferase involved in cell wall biosynthesis
MALLISPWLPQVRRSNDEHLKILSNDTIERISRCYDKMNIARGLFKKIFSILLNYGSIISSEMIMKICIATHHFPPKYYAGAELYAYLLARHLIQSGNEVEVVTIESIEQGGLEPECTTDIYHGIKVHRLSYNHHLAARPFQLLYRNPYVGMWFKRYLQEFQPDLLHVNSGYLLGGTVIEEAKSFGIPTALTLHEYWFLCPINSLLQTSGKVCSQPVPAARCKWCMLTRKRRYRILDQKLKGRVGNAYTKIASSPLLKKWASQDADIRDIEDRREYLHRVFNQVDVVISPSKFLIEKMESYGFYHPNMIQLPYGLENVPNEIPQRKGKSDQLHIGYRGRISPEKGVDLLIQAFKMNPGNQLALYIYGELNKKEPYGKELLKLAQGDHRIHWMGRYNNADLQEVLMNIDVTVVPSRWYENQPYTILESFAYGIPVIATDLGGMTEMIEHGSDGLLFELNNIIDLARQFQRLQNEPDLLSCLQMGIRPVPRVEDETFKTEQLYEPLFANRNP